MKYIATITLIALILTIAGGLTIGFVIMAREADHKAR
jgi:hypothetical protein